MARDELEPSDLELLRSAGRGEHSAFKTLVNRHAEALFQVAMSFSRNRADADDLVQETLLAAYKGAKGFAGRSSARTWLLRILSHEANRAWRRARHRRQTLSFNESAPATSSATAGVDHRMDVMQILSYLSEPHREVLVMREIWDMSYDQIAEALQIPRGTVESRLSRAREQFRKHFEAGGD
jgi:RNA polymerase sigma-70 factor, ECF subfamily